MLAPDAEILKRGIKERKYDEIVKLHATGRMDVGNELVKMFPQLFTKTVERVGANGIMEKQNIVDPGNLSLEGVLEVLQANRRKLDL